MDRWRTSDEEAELVDMAALNFSALGAATCDPANREGALQRFPEAGSDPAVEDCKLLALMDRYTPGAGILDPRDESLVRGEEDRFEVLYFNFPGEGESNWADLAYRQEWEITPPERRPEFMHSYVHPFLRELDDGGYELLLQYWFFYPTNDSGMDHEGDWEHINVVVAPRSMVTEGLEADVVQEILDGRWSLEDGAPDPIVIRRVDYYFHEFVWPLDFSRPNVYLPRDEWEAQVDTLPRTRFREDRVWEDLRRMVYVDDAETVLNTHPLGYIGADNKGLNQAAARTRRVEPGAARHVPVPRPLQQRRAGRHHGSGGPLRRPPRAPAGCVRRTCRPRSDLREPGNRQPRGPGPPPDRARLGAGRGSGAGAPRRAPRLGVAPASHPVGLPRHAVTLRGCSGALQHGQRRPPGAVVQRGVEHLRLVRRDSICTSPTPSRRSSRSRYRTTSRTAGAS